MVDGLAADWSGANSASFVASQNRAKYTCGSEFPAAGCYLKIARWDSNTRIVSNTVRDTSVA
jgi:hypothetical protein